MTKRFFGTDGIRGRVGEDPMTVGFTLRLASAAARVLAPDGGVALIGKDTRVSGYMFESALEAGFVAAGVHTWLTGPLPTPAIAQLTRQLGANFGIVISASHNPYEDNGIKFFQADGNKLSDDAEAQIEALLDEAPVTRSSVALGKAKQLESARDRYEEFCRQSFPQGLALNGLKVVIDCAHGAAYKTAPRVLADLGADLVPVGCSPNGRNINDGCGSTRPELLQAAVPSLRADAGIALDGDGDRVVMVDRDGKLVDGDQLLYILALDRLRRGRLQGPVVGTVMSNLGLELALREQGIEFLRASVGDRHVLALLRERRGELGGETSGHLLSLDLSPSGDGLLNALQVLAVMQRSGRSLGELAAGMPYLPQVLVNVRVARKIRLEDSKPLQAAVDAAQRELGERGRIVLRPSGTEPVIRVMVEGEDAQTVSALAQRLGEQVQQVAAGLSA